MSVFVYGVFAMARMRIWFNVTVKDSERAFLTRDGRFERLLGPGKFSALDWNASLAAEVLPVLRAEIAPEKAFLLQTTHPHIAEDHFEFVQTGPGEVAIVSLDGEPKHLVGANSTRVFWKTVTKVSVERIDTEKDLRIAPGHLAQLDLTRSTMTALAVVEQHEAGLLIVDGELRERLKPGRHAFWAVARNVRVAKIDLRPQLLEVTAQEILTKDRVGIRVTLAAFYKIVDPALAATASSDVGATLYRLIQFAIREAVALRTLDDILAARDSIDKEVRAFVTERSKELGAEVGEIGVKDVILPGEVRDLLNKVVEAERVAKANLIRRQEETAATRSLLNTAKLMENNPLLLRLKELEALEKLVEKVGRIDLHAGAGAGGFDALLTKLYSLSRDGEGSK